MLDPASIAIVCVVSIVATVSCACITRFCKYRPTTRVEDSQDVATVTTSHQDDVQNNKETQKHELTDCSNITEQEPQPFVSMDIIPSPTSKPNVMSIKRSTKDWPKDHQLDLKEEGNDNMSSLSVSFSSKQNGETSIIMHLSGNREQVAAALAAINLQDSDRTTPYSSVSSKYHNPLSGCCSDLANECATDYSTYSQEEFR